jgi:DNA-binding beta-propeller fold protein YncE
MKRFILLALLLSLIAIPAALAQEDDDKPDPYTTGVFPRAMAFDGQRVWVANWVDNTITILDAESGEYLETLEGNEISEPVALAWDGSHMWVASYQNNRVYRLDANGEVQTVFDANQDVQGPIDLLFDGAHIWIVNQGSGARPGTVIKIVAATVATLGTYDVGHFPTSIAMVNDEMWVANGFDNNITILRADTGDRVGRVDVASFPFSITFDGRHVWVSHYDGTLMLVNNSSREIDESIVLEEIPGRPIELLYAFERVWITNVDDASIARFKANNGVLLDTETAGQFPASLVATQDEVWIANWLDYEINSVAVDVSGLEPENEPDVVATNVAVLLPSPMPTSTPTLVPITNCNPEAPSRLRPGDRGRIDAEGDQRPLTLRDGVEGNRVESYPILTEFVVLDGPFCDSQDRAWYSVELIEGGEQGWFVEALFLEGVWDYTIEPDTLEGDE